MALIGSIDQGTSSSRFLIFDLAAGNVVTFHQIEVGQKYPHDGWVEMCPNAMLSATVKCMERCCENLIGMGRKVEDVKAIGITNQRETTIIWDKHNGEPLCHAVVWLDARTAPLADQMTKLTPDNDQNHFKPLAGLPIHPYFSALKIRWLMDNVPEVRKGVDEGRALFGTVDSWLIWKLTDGQSHVTDVTNASRTLLMDLRSMQWSPKLCQFFNIQPDILPRICSSAEVYGQVQQGPLQGVPLSGCLGDQQAALVGQNCLTEGAAKNTYGTGTFMLCNTGESLVLSKSGLLTTVAFKLGKDAATYYALEGAGSIGGTSVRWLRDQLGIIESSDAVEALAASVANTEGVYFVPCFSGLFSPYWDPTARGTICGLTQSTNKAHLARATLESVCFQTREMLDAIEADTGKKLAQLKVDGGMTKNQLVLQTQADLLNAPVVRVSNPELTGWGAAVAAAIGVGLTTQAEYQNREDSSATVTRPKNAETRDERLKLWKKAVQKAMHWAAH